MPKESLWAFSEQMKEELAGQLSPILDETEAWLSIRAAIRGTAAETHIRQERSLQVEELPPENVTIGRGKVIAGIKTGAVEVGIYIRADSAAEEALCWGLRDAE